MTDQQILLHKTCRACRGNLEEILNLGNLRLNAFPRQRHEVELVPRVPLILTVCVGCGLVQLDRTVPPDWLYREYHYRSGVNELMIQELQGIVEQACALVDLQPGDRVLDIGANDGTLLSHYPDGVHRTAVEPALNLQDRLRVHCDVLVSGYFPAALTDDHFKIITAIAMSYDLEDPEAFFTAIGERLAPDGVAIIQFQDVEQQIRSAAFDTICHEHLEYYSLWSLTHLLVDTGLYPYACQQTPINGGSLRVILKKGTVPRTTSDPSIWAQLLRESHLGLDTPTLRRGDLRVFTRFRLHVRKVQRQIQAALTQVTDGDLLLDVYGASTKGNILLQVLETGPGQVRQAIDRSPEKAGRYTITGIPIVGEEMARADPASVWLSPIWQFRESVLRREAWFLAGGGTILFPLPYPEIVRQQWRP